MRTQQRRGHGLFVARAVALALWAYSAGPSVAQQPEPRLPPPDLTVPNAVVLGVTPSGSGVAQQPERRLPPSDLSAPNAVVLGVTPSGSGVANASASDRVNRVPNFFGDFVARPSVGLVNQPRTTTTSSSTSASTSTLTFLGLPGDVAGGINRTNTFYAPFQRPGFVGPGGPYQLFTNVTGFGVRIPPDISILNENAELTAKINAKFPGATFVSGLAGLEGPNFVNIFEYLLSTSQGGTVSQTVPGLVALINMSNPSGGGLVGRNKYFDGGSPVPHDRVFFDYNHIGAFQTLGPSFDINRYVFGVEKTFLGGMGSIEVVVPFAGTMDSDQNGGQQLAVNNIEFGNVGLLLKTALFRNANWLVGAGVGVSMPTADNSRLLFADRPVIEIRNRAWLVQPIVGAVWAPTDRFYVQSGVQLDFDPSGNPVYVRSPGGEFSQRGILTDQTYLYASGAAGYWIYQSDTRNLSGVSLQGELHYDRTLGKRDFVQTGSVLVTDLNDNIDVLNATFGVNFVFHNRATLALAVSLPVAGERLYDWNLMARLNVRFGPGSR